MPKIIIDPNKPETVVASVRQFLEESREMYAGLINEVPEMFKSQVEALKNKLDVALTSLASRPTDQVPAALDAAQALNHVSYTLKYMQDMFTGTMEALNKMVAEFAPKSQQLQSLQGRIEKKELIEATEVEKQINQAVEQAKTKERERAAMLNSRRQVLAKSDVPLPLQESALEGDEKAWETAKAKAEDRTKKLKDIGALSAMNAEDLSKLIYGPDEVFSLALTVAGKKTQDGQQAEPLAGGRTEGVKPRKLAYA